MSDMIRTGQEVIETIKRTKPADVGDLTIAIGDLITELNGEVSDQGKPKLDHLRGLFDCLTTGKEYELPVTKEEEPDIFQSPQGFIMPAVSGVYQPNLPLKMPPGSIISGSIDDSVIIGRSNVGDPVYVDPNGDLVTTLPPSNDTPPSDSNENIKEQLDEPEPEPEPKPEFKPRWWQKKV